jgi:hypothetical protein
VISVVVARSTQVSVKVAVICLSTLGMDLAISGATLSLEAVLVGSFASGMISFVTDVYNANT